MKTEMVSRTGGATGTGSRPDRRAFLRVGAGCAMPLLAGGVLAARGPSREAETVALGSVGQDAVDPVLAHLEQELVRTYHAMRGPAGIRGEHVRSLAAHLELVGVCLDSHPAIRRCRGSVSAADRRARVRRRGPGGPGRLRSADCGPLAAARHHAGPPPRCCETRGRTRQGRGLRPPLQSSRTQIAAEQVGVGAGSGRSGTGRDRDPAAHPPEAGRRLPGLPGNARRRRDDRFVSSSRGSRDTSV